MSLGKFFVKEIAEDGNNLFLRFGEKLGEIEIEIFLRVRQNSLEEAIFLENEVVFA